ncbi:MAG: hypothetical protein K2X77_24040 [Candidatus Obscuribacterales bacterium]|jgi:hypothetical protein|nr:hypothetical protein [Candidatus Obscuribacterales bacterium]
MTSHILKTLKGMWFALLLFAAPVAYAADAPDCMVNEFLLRTKSAGDGSFRRIPLGDKHDFVISAPARGAGAITKSIYFIEKFPRLVSLGSKKDALQYDVQMPAGTIVIVEHNNEDSHFRIAALAGRVVFINIHKQGKAEEFSISAGQEVCIAESDYSEELLIPSDGVDREPYLSPRDPFFKMAFSKFDRKQMLLKEPLLTWSGASNANHLLKIAKSEIARSAPLRYVPHFASVKNTTVSHHDSKNVSSKE